MYYARSSAELAFFQDDNIQRPADLQCQMYTFRFVLVYTVKSAHMTQIARGTARPARIMLLQIL